MKTKSFFDLSRKKQNSILKTAAQASNKAQKELLDKWNKKNGK